MQLHVANDHIPADSPARPLLHRVKQLLVQVIDEGCDAVRGLRSGYGDSDNLGNAFAQIGEEFTKDQTKDYSVFVEGTQQQLHPIRNRDIAEKLFISEETVKVHIKHIMEKLGATDRTQAAMVFGVESFNSEPCRKLTAIPPKWY